MIQPIHVTHPTDYVPHSARRWLTLFTLIGAILAVFVARTVLANSFRLPRLFEIFDLFTVAASLVIVIRGRGALRATDWISSIAIGIGLGILVPFATLFNPYPFLDRFDGPMLHAVLRGSDVALALLGGIVIMRWGGPVPLRLARGEWHKAVWGVVFGALIGIPLAVLNLFANSWTQAQPMIWQNPLAAGLDALQPAVLEEVVYRFALLGLLWLILRSAFPRQAVWISGLLVILIHSYGHYSELLVQSPVVALGMGAVMGLIWGVPLTILASRRDLESAIGFHWMQDALRFWGGL